MRLFLILLASLFALPAPAPAADEPVGGLAPARRQRKAHQPDTPESLYNKGVIQFKRGYYDDAILSFEKVRNHFPFNQYSVLAELKVADCLYEKSSYLEAVDAYLRFSKLHPRHPEIDYVVYRTARAEFRLAPVIPQRDQAHSSRGLDRIRAFEERFPDSEYVQAVQDLRGKALDRLARGAMQVGNFYWKQKEWKAAERRYRLATEEFGDAPIIDRARYRRGLCLWRMGEEAAGREILAALVARGGSRWAKSAKTFLDRHAPGQEGVPPTPPG